MLDPAISRSSFMEVASLLWKHWELTWAMTRRLLTAGYSGEILGSIWIWGHPLIQILIYIFVFSVVFQIRYGTIDSEGLPYTAYLLSGLVPWLGVTGVLTRSPSVITSEASLVRQIAFPLEVLPIRVGIAGILIQLIYVLGLAVYVVVVAERVPWTYLVIPIVIVLQVIAMIGLAFFISAVSVFLRDLKDVVQILCTVGIFIVPIFYRPSMLPGAWKAILFVNPFSYLIWCYQDIFYYHSIEHPWAWVIWTLFALGMFVLGYRVFNRLKTLFGNAI